MNQNIGTTDRLVRLIAALVLAALYFTRIFAGTAVAIAVGLAAVLVLTSFLRFCPLYLPFGIRTRRD